MNPHRLRAAWLCLLLVLPLPLHAQPAIRTRAATARLTPGPPAQPRALEPQDEFDLLDIDTLFYIDNQGLTRVLVEVNEYTFRLTTDPEDVHRGANTFLMPLEGNITLNIAAAIHPGEGNRMRLQGTGPEGSSADVIIGDLLVTGRIDYVLVAEVLPEAFGLAQNYPNPFQRSTTITYRVPDRFQSGVATELSVYNVLGQRVRRLVDDRRFGGTFTLEWDGRDEAGAPVAGGVYFYRLRAGDFQQVRRMLLVR